MSVQISENEVSCGVIFSFSHRGRGRPECVGWSGPAGLHHLVSENRNHHIDKLANKRHSWTDVPNLNIIFLCHGAVLSTRGGTAVEVFYLVWRQQLSVVLQR